MTTAKNLDKMKSDLYEAFERAVAVGLADMEVNAINNRALAAEVLKSVAAMAEAIVSIEREQREAQECGHIKLAKPASPGKSQGA